jgi:hypothetical protein
MNVYYQAPVSIRGFFTVRKSALRRSSGYSELAGESISLLQRPCGAERRRYVV